MWGEGRIADIVYITPYSLIWILPQIHCTNQLVFSSQYVSTGDRDEAASWVKFRPLFLQQVAATHGLLPSEREGTPPLTLRVILDWRGNWLWECAAASILILRGVEGVQEPRAFSPRFKVSAWQQSLCRLGWLHSSSCVSCLRSLGTEP